MDQSPMEAGLMLPPRLILLLMKFRIIRAGTWLTT